MSGVRRAAGRLVRASRRWLGHPAARGWAPYSRLFLRADHPGWVLAYEMSEIAALAAAHGYQVAPERLWPYVRRQCVFYASHLDLLLGPGIAQPNRLATAYFHGRPGSGYPQFDEAFAALRRHHARLARVQVTHREMEQVVLASGIEPAKVFRIPLAVNPSLFARVTTDARRQARIALGVPADAVVVGSFQKDGVGWGEGREPKLIKGPDVLLDVLARLADRITGLFVVISGPARGYVRAGLERLAIPYVHHFIDDPRRLAPLYHASDVCLVTSRQEGGPKAVFEAMACGVPIVSTRVGQAADLIAHAQNGWLADVEDVAALAHWTETALSGAAPQVEAAFATVSAHTYIAQAPLWAALFGGFLAPPVSRV